jgi:hypothetical protein
MEASSVQPAPVPIPFPVEGAMPGPRCGHTLTVVIGSEQRLSNSKLVMFGTSRAVELRVVSVDAQTCSATQLRDPCSATSVCRRCNSPRRPRWRHTASSNCSRCV